MSWMAARFGKFGTGKPSITNACHTQVNNPAKVNEVGPAASVRSTSCPCHPETLRFERMSVEVELVLVLHRPDERVLKPLLFDVSGRSGL